MKQNTIFYHGTTTAFGRLTKILPPEQTGVEREIRSRKRADMVYITPSALSAANYAKKATLKFGGEPVLYQVKPHGNLFYVGNNEWITDLATVISEEEVY